MKLVAHQPQYLPYLGYFYKISLADTFIALDHVQYSRNGVQNRNVIRGPSGPLALTVPVLLSGRFGAAICDIEIDNRGPWARKHWRSIEQAYRRYPYFADYASDLERVYNTRWDRLVDLNLALMQLLQGWLGIPTPVRRSSEFKLGGSRTAMLVELCRQAGATTYVSGSGARDYLEPRLFEEAGIRLCWSEFHHPAYSQIEEPQLAELSVIDALMNLGPAAQSLVQEAERLSLVTSA